jgi:hypothetical protein
MLDYTNVTREIRSLIARRRELLTFLGTVFAVMGLFLQNVLQENMPEPYSRIREHGFAYYAFLLMIPSLILALRLAKLNAGMTLNGMMYQRLMQQQDFTRKATPESVRRAGRLNVFGVGFLMSFLADIIAGFSAALLVLALRRPGWLGGGRGGAPLWLAVVVGATVVVVWVLLYLYFHVRAVRFGLLKAAEPCLPFRRDQWEEHQAGSMEDANRDMITILAVVGLIVFSAFEGLSGLGKVAGTDPDISLKYVQEDGPIVYGLLMAVTCLLSMVTYIRLRIAIGHRSLDLDPMDRPFRPLRLTDSLLGYMLLSFLLVVSVHFLLYETLHEQTALLFTIDAVVFVVALAVEQVSLVVAGRGIQRK